MTGLLHAMSIRWRLALLSAGLTFLVLCGFAVVIGQLTASRVRTDFNNQTAAAVDDLRDRLRITWIYGTPVVVTNLSDYAGSAHAVIRVIGEHDGFPAIVSETPKAPDFDGGQLPFGRTRRVGGYQVETRTTVVHVSGRSAGLGLPVYIEYARRVSEVEATVKRVRLFLLLGVLGGSGLALGLALMLSRRAMAPIARLTSTARDIERTRDPSRRVPIPDTDDEVAELALTLDGMLQSLESSRADTAAMLDRQRQFVADASHELRTPLTSVLANLELLAEVLDGERGEAARSALRSTQRMRRLVADLLLLARADARRESPHEPIDLARVVVDAAGELGPVAADHLVSVQTDPAMVAGARDELHRMALNLMENAVRHTPPGTRVEATVKADHDHVRLIVADDGPGVPPDLRDRLFERFVRGGGDHAGSVGLGLSIVRAVARSHGGDVVLDSEAVAGARFVVTLPALGTQEDAPAEAPSTAAV